MFVLTTLTDLAEVTDFVRAANQAHRLKALLIREDADTRALPQILDRANVRTLRNTLVHSGPEVPQRVLNAWLHGAQDDLIASAHTVGDKLMVITCALDVLEVRFGANPALAAIPAEQRSNFEIASEGSYIHWPVRDVHLDLDGIRYTVDPAFRAKKDAERIAYDHRFGAAVSAVRKAHGLRQTAMRGLSARQLRRIERGERPTHRALAALAASHGMSVNGYLNDITLHLTNAA